MMVYICTKLHENILNGIRVMERTRKVNGWPDGQMDRQTDGPVFDGRIKMIKTIEVYPYTLMNSPLPRLVVRKHHDQHR